MDTRKKEWQNSLFLFCRQIGVDVFLFKMLKVANVTANGINKDLI